MFKYIKHNLKLLLITLVALVLIVLNSASIFDNLKQSKNAGTYRRPANPLSFYDKDCIPFTLTSKNGNAVNLPDSGNHIIIGINEQFDRDIEILYYQLKNLNLDEYDADVIAVTLTDDYGIDYGINVYNYNDAQLGEFLNLSDNKNFTFIVDEYNKIKFFKYQFLEIRELELILNRFKKVEK